ncbi:hypothetical protein GCM10009838_26790 [Catenulispora subtropica]|uniref:Streptomyces killer toxin-like beta/gamma crystallin domain-containing protein n=1 Tax=Catenulispora subtropica TaxID=450798 RepID=A0ABN2RDH1_9ACTN
MAAVLAASGGLLVAAPAAGHAAVRPAATNACGGDVDFHTSNGLDLCLKGGYARTVYLNTCGITSVNTGSNWVDWTWGINLSLGHQQPGTAPWTTWTPGMSVCIGKVDIDT